MGKKMRRQIDICCVTSNDASAEADKYAIMAIGYGQAQLSLASLPSPPQGNVRAGPEPMARPELADLSNSKKASRTIPAGRSKNGVAHYVPLSALAYQTI